MSQRRARPGARGVGRGPSNPGAAGGPGGPAANAGARGALLLGVAVIIGIVLLQQFDDGIDTGGQVVTASSVPVETSTTVVRRGALTTVPVVTTTTVRARAKADVKVLVANGAGVRGLGAATTNALKNVGYTTLTPTDATSVVEKTGVQFAEGYETEAREVAAALSLPATVVTKLAAPPVAATDIGDAKVIVVLGTDVASSTTTASTAVVGSGTSSSTTTTIRRP